MSDLGLSILEQAKYNMIEQQIRPCEVNNPTIIDALHAINRHEFVPEIYTNLAYADCQIPFADAQIMMKPLQEGKILQALNIQESEKCLEIGTGTGYFTACLASLGNTVYSIDINNDILNLAKHKLEKQFNNIHFECGDAFEVVNAKKKYDVIAVTAAVSELPDDFKQALNVGGRLFIILGNMPTMHAMLITRISDNEWTTASLFETEMNQLIN